MIKTENQSLLSYRRYIKLPTNITAKEASSLCGASKSSVTRWRRGECIPKSSTKLVFDDPKKQLAHNNRKNRRTEYRETLTANLSTLNMTQIAKKEDNYEHTFKEIGEILRLSEDQVRVLYLNAIHKIQVILDNQGIKISVPITRQDIEGQF